jgi:hypothetical protein
MVVFLQSTLVAVVFPEKASLESWAAGHGLSHAFDNLIANDSVKKLLLDELVKLGASKGLKGFEQVCAVKCIILFDDTEVWCGLCRSRRCTSTTS